MANSLVKRYIIWAYFLLYPLTNAWFPNLDLGVVEFNPVRIYMLLPLAYLAHLFIINKGRVRISKESLFLLLYTLFSLYNSWIKGNFIIANILNLMFPVLFIIVFENLDYDEKDLAKFYRMLSILAVIVVAVSLYQNFVDNRFYAGIRGERWLERYVDYGVYRHSSIFRSIDFYQAGMAIGLMCVLFMFLNFEKLKPKYLALCLMMLISTYYTLTRSNWIIPMFGLFFFVYYKPLRKKLGYLIVIAFVSLMLYVWVLPKIQESETYRNRVVTNTYEGRFVSLEVYYEHFFGRNMITGFGIDSGYSGMFRTFRRPEVHNGYLEILFRDGLIGVFLYFGFWYYVYRRGKLIHRFTGNGVFIVFIVVFLASNFIYKFISMAHFGYHLMLFYMNILYQIHVPGGQHIAGARHAATVKTELSHE